MRAIPGRFAGAVPRLALLAALLSACVASSSAEDSPPGAICRLATNDVAALWRTLTPPPGTAARFAALPSAVIAPERLAAFVAGWDLASRLAAGASSLVAAVHADDAGRFSVVAGFHVGVGGGAEDILLAWETALLLSHPGVVVERVGGTALAWRLPGDKAEIAASRDGEWLWMTNDASRLRYASARRDDAPGGATAHMERLFAPLLAIPGAIPENVAREYGGIAYAVFDEDGLAALADLAVGAVAGFPERFAAAGAAVRERSAEALRETWLAAQLAYSERGAYAGVDIGGEDAASGWFTRSGALQKPALAPDVAAADGPEAVLLYEAEAWREGGRRLITQDGTPAAVAEGRFAEMLRRGGAEKE